MRKKKVYYRDFDSYRILLNYKKYEALKDLSDCLDGKATISIDAHDLRKLEDIAREEARDIDFTIGEYPHVEPWCTIFIEGAEGYKGRNCIVMVSGDYTTEVLLETVDRIARNLSDDCTSIIFGAINRQCQSKCRITCLAY